MTRFLIFILTTIIINCSSPGNPSPSSNIDTLKNSVLESACNESHKKSLKRTIAHQEKALTEEEMKRSLKNMKEDINCD